MEARNSAVAIACPAVQSTRLELWPRWKGCEGAKALLHVGLHKGQGFQLVHLVAKVSGQRKDLVFTQLAGESHDLTQDFVVHQPSEYMVISRIFSRNQKDAS